MTEEITRAAYTIDSAAENIRRAADIMDATVSRLVPLLAEGYGNQLSHLIEELQEFNSLHRAATPTPALYPAGTTFAVVPPYGRIPRPYAWVDEQGRLVKRSGDIYFDGGFITNDQDAPASWTPLWPGGVGEEIYVLFSEDDECLFFRTREAADEYAGNNAGINISKARSAQP